VATNLDHSAKRDTNERCRIRQPLRGDSSYVTLALSSKQNRGLGECQVTISLCPFRHTIHTGLSYLELRRLDTIAAYFVSFR
jgi:hypothetical protein